MASYLDKRKESDRREPAKRQRVSEAKLQRPLRRSARLNIASCEPFEQQKSVVLRKDQSIAPQPRRRKRSHEAENSSTSVPAEPFSENLRPSVDTAATSPADLETPFGSTETPVDPVGYWAESSAWPKKYFEPDTISLPLGRRGSTRSLRRKRSELGSLTASSITPSDQKPRDERSVPYRDVRYESVLATKGSFMDTSDHGITDASKAQCLTLLEKEQVVPQDSLFRDDLFASTCRKIRNRNKTRVIRDISLLIVPSAETMATYGAKHLEILIESTNEGWNNSIPLIGTRPQPAYSVGFRQEAFSEERHEKLQPLIGDFIGGNQSYFMATYYMYFPFLTCEIECGAASLDIADRQNTHSMTLAVRAVVELFRLVGREKEIDREILAFSVSHYTSVRIYGYYAVVDGSKTTFYRHPIHSFDFTGLDGKEKWTAYKFIKSVYDTWMPNHFRRLCSAIDDLPSGINFDVPPLLQDSGLSQELGSRHLTGSFGGSIRAGDNNSQSGIGITIPDTSFTQQTSPKKRKSRASE